MNKPEPVHLGDGAYVSPGSYRGEIIITANHHDPELASDAVYLGPHATMELMKFIMANSKSNADHFAKELAELAVQRERSVNE